MWSMPQSVLRVVAVIVAICAVSGFTLGLRNVPDKARLPGESAGGGASALEATDAQPVGELLVTDPPPPPPEEKADEEDTTEKTEEVRAAEMAKLEAEAKALAAIKAAAAPKATPPEDKVGDLIESLPPPPEQPPY